MSSSVIFNLILAPLNLTNITVIQPVNLEPKVSLPAIIATWLLVPIMLLSTVLNVIVLLAFVTDRKLWTPFNYYLCNLGVCDTIIGSIDTVFYFIYNRSGVWPSTRAACDLWLYIDWIVTIAVAYSLMFISLDRLWAITYPIGYRTYHSRRLSALTIAVMWVAVNLIVLPGFLIERRTAKDDESRMCYQDLEMVKSWTVSAQFLGYYLPHVTVIITNVIIGIKLRQSLSSLGVRGPAGGSSGAASTGAAVVPGGLTLKSCCTCRLYSTDTSPSCTHVHLTLASSPSRTLHHLSYSPVSQHLFSSAVMEASGVNMTLNGRNLDLGVIAPLSKGHAVSTRDNDGRSGRKKQSVASLGSMVGGSLLRRYIRKKDRRALRLLVSLVICFTVCWTPSYAYFSLMTFLPKYQNEAFYSFSYVLSFTNSLLNPLLYHIGSKEFRTAINRLLARARAMASCAKQFKH
ncbi:hypothetical protein RvY_06992 [Ramazzottius varieornatus]|uniref:G-protein coupled receptors family 1 profile domain-containing protein n=1 Tax=Ramazzottius varieornatus TaxID=947166 RepID=A0A1D1V5Q7_RAMVA|nr:hypothetical protein RvY_06992 [Ramazzottius varieornatus]